MKWIGGIIYVLWFVMGLLLGAAVASGTSLHGLLVDSTGRIQWEVLATGFAAVIVAIWTISKLNEQIRQTEDLAIDQRKRRARAAQAVLPLALSELGQYADTCVNKLFALRPYFQSAPSAKEEPGTKAAPVWQPPRLPENVLSLIKECIEFSDDAPARALCDLVRHYQIQNYRLAEDIAKMRNPDGVHLLLWENIEQDIRDAAELQALAAALFSFARGEEFVAAPLDRNQIRNALFISGSVVNTNDIDRLATEWENDFKTREARKAAH